VTIAPATASTAVPLVALLLAPLESGAGGSGSFAEQLLGMSAALPASSALPAQPAAATRLAPPLLVSTPNYVPPVGNPGRNGDGEKPGDEACKAAPEPAGVPRPVAPPVPPVTVMVPATPLSGPVILPATPVSLPVTPVQLATPKTKVTENSPKTDRQEASPLPAVPLPVAQPTLPVTAAPESAGAVGNAVQIEPETQAPPLPDSTPTAGVPTSATTVPGAVRMPAAPPPPPPSPAPSPSPSPREAQVPAVPFRQMSAPKMHPAAAAPTVAEPPLATGPVQIALPAFTPPTPDTAPEAAPPLVPVTPVATSPATPLASPAPAAPLPTVSVAVKRAPAPASSTRNSAPAETARPVALAAGAPPTASRAPHSTSAPQEAAPSTEADDEPTPDESAPPQPGPVAPLASPELAAPLPTGSAPVPSAPAPASAPPSSAPTPPPANSPVPPAVDRQLAFAAKMQPSADESHLPRVEPTTPSVRWSQSILPTFTRSEGPAADPVPSRPDVAPSRPLAETTADDRPKAAQPVKQISLQLTPSGNASDQKVQVQLMHQAGELRVAVHTGDSDLAHGLRERLSDLVSRLQETGYHTETWRPVDSPAALGAASEARSASGDTRDGDSQPQPGWSQQQSQEQQHDESDRPRWVQELELNMTGAAS